MNFRCNFWSLIAPQLFAGLLFKRPFFVQVHFSWIKGVLILIYSGTLNSAVWLLLCPNYFLLFSVKVQPLQWQPCAERITPILSGSIQLSGWQLATPLSVWLRVRANCVCPLLSQVLQWVKEEQSGVQWMTVTVLCPEQTKRLKDHIGHVILSSLSLRAGKNIKYVCLFVFKPKLLLYHKSNWISVIEMSYF